MGRDGGIITHYEVYVLELRGWTLQVRFARHEKDLAMEEAKLIERTLNLPVKVVRETYFPSTNSSQEVTAYLSPLAGPHAVGAAVRNAASIPPPRERRRPKGARSPRPTARPSGRGNAAELGALAIVVRLLAIVFVGLVVATFAAGLISALASHLGFFGINVAPENLPRLVFISFAGAFLLTAGPLTVTFVLSHINWDRGGEGRGRGRARPPRAIASGPDVSADPAAAPVPAEPLPDPTPEPVPEPIPEIAVLPDPEPPPDEEPPPSGEAAVVEAPGDEPAGDEPAEVEDEAAERQDDGLEKHRFAAMRFLEDIVSVLKRTRPQLDPYNKFGIDLMLAGAIEVLSDRNRLDETARRRLLAEMIELLGTRREMAALFCDRYEEYLLEPRYLRMVQMGRDAMFGVLDGSDGRLSVVEAALDGWNQPAPAQPQGQAQKIITVIFTDMVGSTDMTQSRGDFAAQEVVRRHNAIVRQALSDFDGREVKHTGDGIMASFGSTGKAVDAAAAIQRAVAAHNHADPSLPLHLRIGINAGEPIQEEDDLFGTTVQLSARVCAAAAADQVLCSNVVRELSAGKGRLFLPRGKHALKGFRDEIDLYEVAWNLEEIAEPVPDIAQDGQEGAAAGEALAPPA